MRLENLGTRQTEAFIWDYRSVRLKEVRMWDLLYELLLLKRSSCLKC